MNTSRHDEQDPGVGEPRAGLGAESGTTWLDIGQTLRVRWRIGLVTFALVVCAAGALAIFLPDQYRATVTILPTSSSQIPGVLSSLRAVGNLLEDPSNPNEPFYGRIAVSDTVLNRMIERDWPALEHRTSLYELLSIDCPSELPSDSLLCAQELKEVLREDVISFSRDALTSFMTLSCTFAGEPVVASRLANALVEEIDSLNRRMSQRDARAQRIFVEERLLEVEQNVQSVESALVDFLSANRDYTSSPALSQEYRALMRLADANQAMWIELKRQHELARIEENKNLTSIRVLDWAYPPQEPTGPDRIVIMMVGVAVGAFLAVLTSLGAHLVQS